MEASASVTAFIDELFTMHCYVCGEETDYYICDKCRQAILWARQCKEEEENVKNELL